MSRPVLLITRPAGESSRSINIARSMGFDSILSPLFRIVSLPFEIPEKLPQALLFTSPRAPEHSVRQEPQLTAIPCWAVGKRTADAAREAGFTIAYEGVGDGLQPVKAAAAAGITSLLHLCGEAVAQPQPLTGIEVSRIPVYAAQPLPALSAEAAEELKAGRIFATMLFSGRTASHFSELLKEEGLARARHRIIAISPAAAAAAGDGWKAIHIAERPSLNEMLATASRVWQETADV